MAMLTERDFKKAMAVLRELHAPLALDEFPRAVLRLLPQVVPAGYISYNEVNVRRRRVLGMIEPMQPDFERLAALLEPHLAQHPVIAYYNATRDGSAHAISDFLSAREFHRTSLYNEFYRPLGIEDQMALTLRIENDDIVALTFNRSRRNFSMRERELLNLLQPHLRQAYLNATALAELQSQIAAHGALFEQMAGAVVLLSPAGRITFCSAQAALWLREYFVAEHRPSPLPQAVRRWLASARQNPAAPLRVRRGDRSLLVRCLTERGGARVLLLSEESATTPLRALQTLGLTARQAEVLFYLAQGESNAQIAARLCISPHTAKRHLEAVFDRLGVRSRAAATRRALQVLGLASFGTMEER
jgi:DNA-binding CsgD family transcriptional regulator